MTEAQKIIYNTALVFHEIEQLLAFERHGLTNAGDTILHYSAKSLIQKGLACRINGQYALTSNDQKLAEEIINRIQKLIS